MNLVHRSIKIAAYAWLAVDIGQELACKIEAGMDPLAMPWALERVVFSERGIPTYGGAVCRGPSRRA